MPGMKIIATKHTQGRNMEGELIMLSPPATKGTDKDGKTVPLDDKGRVDAKRKATHEVTLRDGIMLCEMGAAVPADDRARAILEKPQAFLSTRTARALTQTADNG